MRQGYVTKEVAQIVLERAENKCEYCGNYRQVGDLPHEIHHVVGRKVPATPDNLKYLCWKCHHGKNSVEDKPNSGKDLEMKLELQDLYFNLGHAEKKVRELMSGRIYA